MWIPPANTVESTRRKRICRILLALLAAGFAAIFIYYIVDSSTYLHVKTNKSGLDFMPKPEESNAENLLIWYKYNVDNNTTLTKQLELDDFLKYYQEASLTPGRKQNIRNCTYDNPPASGQVCEVNVKDWKPCISDNYYGYYKKEPCVFLKFNKIFGWIPEYYNDSNNLPENMPQDLKDHIKSIAPDKRNTLNTVWVTCEGENPADIENIGSINYIPKRGFPGYFYPYNNTEGYLSPLVAVHFENPQIGILINIECKAWAKNIKHDGQENIGIVKFELLID